MKILTLEHFLDTPDFHRVIDTINNSSSTDKITLKLKNNTGGLLNLGETLLLALIKCKSQVTFVAEERVISTAAYVWMQVYLNKSDSLFSNILPTVDKGLALFIYHRPKAEENGVPKFIEELINKDLIEKFLPDVKASDKCLALFLDRHKNFKVFKEGDKTTPYTHKEIFGLYVRNHNIHIPIGVLGNIIGSNTRSEDIREELEALG